MTSSAPAPSEIAPRERELAGGAASASIPFEAILTVAQTPLSTVRGFADDRASPTQVFDPVPTDAHQRRQAALADTYRGDVSARADEARDIRSGIEARQPSESGFSPKGPPGNLVSRSEVSTLGSNRGTDPVFTEPGNEGSSSRSTPGTNLHAAAAGARGDSARPSGMQTSFGSPATPIASAHGQQTDQAQSVSTIRLAGTTGTSSQTNPASQVAKMLASGRSTEVQPTRSVETTFPQASAHKGTTRSESASPSQAGTEEREPARRADASPQPTGRTERPLFEQLVRSLRLRAGAHHSSARMQLDPPELGRLRVDLRVTGDRVRIDVRTETARAHELLGERVSRLSDALAEAGIRLDHFEVNIGLEDALSQHEVSHDHSGATDDGTQPRAGGKMGAGASAGSSAQDDTPSGWEEASIPEVVAETRLDIRI